jgi:hypothetical protein
MSNKVVRVTRQSWGQRVANSIGGLIVGLIMIPAAMWAVWAGEGTQDLSKIASSAILVNVNAISSANEGAFISASGPIASNEQLGDPPYMADKDYITLKRTVEMYAWDETKNETTQDDTIGGGSTTTTTYTYNKIWTEYPADSSRFEESAGHQNPSMVLKSQAFAVPYATIGSYELNPLEMTVPDGVTVMPDPVELPQGYVTKGEYIFSADRASSAAEVGDIRISYKALQQGAPVTAFGAQKGSSIQSITVQDEVFYRIFEGTHEDALKTMHTEYVIIIWMWRIFGTFFIFMGLQLVVQPLARVLGVIGILGKAVEGITGVINAVIALILGVTISLVSQVAHNIYALIVVLALVIAGIYWYLRRRNLKGPALTAPATAESAPAASEIDTSPPKMT